MNNNNKKRIFIAIIFIILLFLLLTFAGGRSEVAIVEFIDGFDNSLIDSQEVEIGDDAVVPEDPKHKNYVFAGWFLFEDHDIKVTDFTNIEEDLKVIALYAGDANNNGIADDQDDRFSVTFIDGLTNDVIKTESVVVGMNATAPKAPTHRGYTFIGWDKGYTNIVESTTVTAQYVRNEVPVTMYTVTFVDGDTREVIATQKVQEGKAATLPEAPLHENRVFIEWVGEYSNVKENTTVTAIYADDMNNDGIEDATQPHYDITYKDFDGEVLEVIEDVLVDMPTPTISNPEREYYTFAGWNPVVAETVTDNAEYTATYTANNDENGNGTADEEEAHYTITYVDYNDEVIDTFEDVLVGLDTPTVENPTREFYTFAGWNPSVAETVTGNATYKATYTINNDKNGDNIPDETQDKFDVVYVDYDGSVIKEFADVLVDMETPTIANPTREFYTFTGWNPSVAETVTEDATYTATYRANNDKNGNGTADEEEAHYTITYVDYNNEVIDTFEDVLVGLDTPTVENPTREFYTFAGWNPVVAETVTGNATYKATYTINNDKNGDNIPDETQDKFDVVYVDYDGSVIKEFADVLVDMPTPVIDNPTREFYTFTGWNPSVAETVTEDATYTATYRANNDENGNGKADEEETKLVVNFVDGITEETIKSEEVLPGLAATAPEAPKHTNYVFVGWDKEFNNVTTNLTVTALYEDDKNNNGEVDENEDYFTVIYKDHDGKELYNEEVLVDMPTPVIDNPTREFYTFTGWNPSVAQTVTEDATYTATYRANNDENGNGTADEEETKLVVNFVDGITEETIKSEEVLPGLAATAPEAPKHTNYVFVGWDKEFNNVTTNLTVTALYEDDKNNNGEVDENEDYFTVIYKDHDGKELYNEEVLVDMPTPVIDNPTREFYTFTGWNPSVAQTVTEDATYTATYRANNDENGNGTADEEETKLVVNFVDGITEETIKSEEVLPGLAATAPEAPKHTNYVFVGWDKEFNNVTTNLTVTALYEDDKNNNGEVDENEDYFTVIYKDHDGKELYNEEVLVDMPTPVIDNPTREFYTFTGWNPSVAETVTEDATYTATYRANNDENGNGKADEEETKLVVNFVDGITEETIKSEEVLPGLAATAPEAPKHTNYVFVGWDKEFNNVTTNLTVTALYEDDKNNNGEVDENEDYFTVIYKDWDGKELYNEEILVDMPTPKIDNPKRDYYTFAGWNPSVAATVTEDVTYTATYTINNDKNGNQIPDEIDTKYTVIYKDWDNTVLEEVSVLVNLNTPKIANPTRKNYTFAGWNPSVAATVTEDATYTATYRPNNDANGNGVADEEEDYFTVIYKDWNGNELYNKEVLVGMETPTISNPTRDHYTFAGWNPSVAATVTEDATYTATYTINNDENGDNIPDETQDKFDVVYVDYDGEEIYREEVLVGMETPEIANPTREFYTFTGWNPSVAETVTEDATYTATYRANNDENGNGTADEEEDHFTVIYKDFDNSVLSENVDLLVGTKTPVIANPTREHYTFTGWNPSVAETVTEDATYIATYRANNDENGNGTADEEETKLVVNFVDGITEETIKSEEVLPGLAATAPEAPKHTNYVFVGWDKEFNNVTTNLTVTALYEDDKNNNGEVDENEDYFTVIYKDWDGKELYNEEVLVDMPTPVIANPTREHYTFTGWNPSVAATVTEDATYTATYRANNDENGNGTADEEETKLVVNFVDGITEETIKSEEVLPGLAATAPEAPKHTNYVFVGWDKEFNNVTTNLTVTALYEDDKNNNGEVDENEDHFDITYVDHEDNVIEMFEDVLVGLDTPTIDEPTREFYTFTGWNPSVAAKVSKDATYKATYEPINDKNNDNIADEEQDLVIVKFYGMDNETVINQQWIVRGEDAVAPTPQSVSGFTFVRWLQNYTNVQIDELNVYSEYRDSEAPVVSAEVELYNEKNGHYQNANITATVSDNVGVVEVRYLAGEYDKSNYNSANVMTKEADGTYQINGLSENSVYTVFAKDAAGNISVTYVEVEGISILEGEFEDLYATGSFGKLSGFPFLTKYKRELNIVTKENVVISDARVYVGNSFKTIQDFENDSNFGDKIEVSDPTNLEYDVIGDTWQYATVYIQYTETYQVSPTQTATRTTSKVYRTFLSYIFG